MENGFKIQVPDFNTSNDLEGKYISFRIVCTTSFSYWNVFKRYRSFSELNTELVSRFPNTKLPVLPKKKVLGSSLNAAFAEERRISLQTYLEQLLTIPEVCTSVVFLEFLEYSQSFSGLVSHMSHLTAQVEKLQQCLGEFQHELHVANHNISCQNVVINELKEKLTVYENGGVGINNKSESKLDEKLTNTVIATVAGASTKTLRKSISFGGFTTESETERSSSTNMWDYRSLSTNAANINGFLDSKDATVADEGSYGYFNWDASGIGLSGNESNSMLIGDILKQHTIEGMSIGETMNSNASQGHDAEVDVINQPQTQPQAYAPAQLPTSALRIPILDANANFVEKSFSPAGSMWNTNTPLRNINNSLMSSMWDEKALLVVNGGTNGNGSGSTRTDPLSGIPHNITAVPLPAWSVMPITGQPAWKDTLKLAMGSTYLSSAMVVLYSSLENTLSSPIHPDPVSPNSNISSPCVTSAQSMHVDYCGGWVNSFNAVVGMSKPTQKQVDYRNDVSIFFARHIRKSIHAQVFETNTHGCCFLANDPLVISLMLWSTHDSGWYVKLNERLCRLAGGVTNSELDGNSSGMFADDDAYVSKEHTLENVSFSSSNGGNYKVHCIADKNLIVEIRSNVRKDLCFHVFLAEFGHSVEKSLSSIIGSSDCSTKNIFQHSLLLLRAWWYYEVHSYKVSTTTTSGSPNNSNSTAGTFLSSFLPDSALCIMMCAIFTKYKEIIWSPLHALALFFAEYSVMDFGAYVITVNGIIPKSTWDVQVSLTNDSATTVETNILDDMDLSVSPPNALAIHDLYIESTRLVVNREDLLKIQDLAKGSEYEPEMIMPLLPPLSPSMSSKSHMNNNLCYTTIGLTNDLESTAESAITIIHPLFSNNINIMKNTDMTAHITNNTVEKFSHVLQTAAKLLNESLCSTMEDKGIPSCSKFSCAQMFFKNTISRFHTISSGDGVSGGSGDVKKSSMDMGLSNLQENVAEATNTVLHKILRQNVGSDAAVVTSNENSTGVSEWSAEALPFPEDSCKKDTKREMHSQSLIDKIGYGKLLLDGTLIDGSLRLLIRNILYNKGSLPVGEIGKLIQEATTVCNISASLKEKYGGLKKFMEHYKEDFILR